MLPYSLNPLYQLFFQWLSNHCLFLLKFCLNFYLVFATSLTLAIEKISRLPSAFLGLLKNIRLPMVSICWTIDNRILIKKHLSFARTDVIISAVPPCYAKTLRVLSRMLTHSSPLTQVLRCRILSVAWFRYTLGGPFAWLPLSGSQHPGLSVSTSSDVISTSSVSMVY